MARDRKRAKQRRERARRAPGGVTAERRPRRVADEPRAARPRAEEAAEPRAPERPPAPAPEDDPAVDDLAVAPDPLEHASADVELAEAQLAAGRVETADEEAVEEEDDDGAFVAADELEDAAAAPARRPRVTGEEAAPRGRAEAQRTRVVAFLIASWRELQRVQWPDRRQVAQATGVVLGFVIVAGLFLGLADAVFSRLVDAIL
jgi:preprotein translocase subunit SecE